MATITILVIVITILATSSGDAGQQPIAPRDDAVRVARKELSATHSLAPDALRLIAVSPAEWRDSSLGCPERGKVYTPAMTSGFKVTLRESDFDYIVHVAGGRVVVCGSRPDTKVSSAPLIAASLKAGEAVRTALSADLKIAAARVRIVSARPATSDRACAGAPATATGVPYVVEARVDAKTYRYYSDDAVAKNCDGPR